MKGIIETLESRTLLAVTGLPIKIGADGFDMGKRIAATADGGYVVAGLFSGRVDFDPTAGVVNLTSAGDTDIYVARYAADSTLVWVKQFGGAAVRDGIIDQDEIIDIAANPLRAGGPFLGGVSADPRDAAEYVNDIAVGADGSVYVVGSFTGSVDFDPGRGRTVFTTFDDEYHDIFVLKLNTGGGLTWAKQFGGRFTETATSVAVDDAGNVVIGGIFTRNVDFVPGNPSFSRTAIGRADALIMKLNASGTPLWINTFGGEAVDQPELDAVRDVAIDAQGNVYAVGTFAGKNVDFDPSSGVALLHAVDATDGVLVKYSSSGRFRFAQNPGGEGFDGLNHVAVDSAGDIYLAGYFEGEEYDAAAGPTTIPLFATPEDPGDEPEFTDAFIQKLARGRVAWTQQIAGTGVEFIDDMRLDNTGEIVVSGSFYGSARFGSGPVMTSTTGADDFDKDRNERGRELSYDAFLWKLGSSAGATRWVRPLGAAEDDFGAGIAITASNEILLTGRFRTRVDFDPGRGVNRLTGFGMADSFVNGYDEDGIMLA